MSDPFLSFPTTRSRSSYPDAFGGAFLDYAPLLAVDHEHEDDASSAPPLTMSGSAMPTSEHEWYMNENIPYFPDSSHSITDYYRPTPFIWSNAEAYYDHAPEEGQNVTAAAAVPPPIPVPIPVMYPGPPPDALEPSSSADSSPAESELPLTPGQSTTSIPTPRLSTKRKAELIADDGEWKAPGSSNSLGLNLPPRSGKLKENLRSLSIPASVATSSRNTSTSTRSEVPNTTRNFPSAPANTLTGHIQRIPSDGKNLKCPFSCSPKTYSSQTLKRHLRTALEHSGRWLRAVWADKALAERDLATLISIMIGLKFKADHYTAELTEEEMDAVHAFQFDLEAFSESEMVRAEDHPTMSVFYQPLCDLAQSMACAHCGVIFFRNLEKHTISCKSGPKNASRPIKRQKTTVAAAKDDYSDPEYQD